MKNKNDSSLQNIGWCIYMYVVGA